jgi:hypothetical protein
MLRSDTSRARYWRQSVSGIAVFAVFLATGCGGPANGRLEISGNVTLDGVPLDQGVITFTDAERKLPSSGAMIAAGEFHIPGGKGLQPGEYKVSIDSADESNAGGSVGPYSMVIPRSKIPPRYNTETVLTANVTLDGDNVFVFDLTSKP